MPRKLPKSLVKAREKVKKLQSQLKKVQRELKKAVAKEKQQRPRVKKKSIKKQSPKKITRRSTKKQAAAKKPVAQTLVADPLQIGELAPSFTILTDENQTFVLEDCQGQYVVLYFYPKDDTPGCTKEAHDFTASGECFAAKNTIVVGVSRDSVASHTKFKEKHAISYTLLADTDESICQRYGVMKNKTLYGKAVCGIERSTFLIGPRGVIQYIWRGVKVPGHVDEVLATLEQLTPTTA